METFGKYQLVRKIGTGGMAEVFLARTAVAQGLAKTLVIKKIHPAFARSRQFVAMFVDEAKVALGLNHPNIIQVFDFGAVGDTYFLAMEYVEGLDVLRLLQVHAQQKKRVPYGLASYIVQQVSRGLDYAHRKTDDAGEGLAIVHRDISPQNVLLSWDGAVKIVDFGIARARDISEDEGVIKGKFAYMSPEQARGEPVDARSDVYSAGIVLYELVCGRPLFQGKGKDALDLAKAGAIPPPRDYAPDLPDSLERILLRALAFHRDTRYQTARDLQNDLGRFQLSWAQASGDPIDSGVLAQYLSRAVPAEQRAPSARPAAADERRRSLVHVAAVSSLVDHLASGLDDEPRAETPRPEIRDRKHVYVLEGAVRGQAALVAKLGQEAATRVLSEFQTVARGIAFKHEALADDDGNTPRPASGELRFVVGLPVAAEDDASRIIRLALALVDALDGIGSGVEPELRLAVGIQRGAATVGKGKLAKFELDEATTSFAKRLAKSARGADILVGGRVFRAARADWSFEALQPIDLPSGEPGDTEPGVRRARVYRLRGAKERRVRLDERPRSEELIGRELELKALRDAYRDCLVAKKKRPIAISGDTGVGKRTLVSAFLAGIPSSEAFVLRTATRVGTAMTPYGVVADLARDLLGLAEGAEPPEIMRRLERTIPLLYPGEEGSREARGVLQAAGLLLGVRPPEGENIDAEERRQRLLQILLRVEQRLQTDKPLIIVGEDIHWADAETMDLFVRMFKVPTARPILAIVTTRPEPRVLRAIKDASAEIIHLEELDRERRRRFVEAKLASDEHAATLVDEIIARTGGNPFFINEMLDSLVERGVLEVVPEGQPDAGRHRWRDRDAAISGPSSVEDLLATRFDHLPEAEKETLLHAAVMGRLFTANAVSVLLGRDASAELDELVRRGLLAHDDDEYRFKNDMTMSVAYGLLAKDDRGRLHRHAAERIAGASTYRRGQDDAIIARHLELAGDARAAAERYLAAASHALDIGGNADAFRQLTRALKLLPDDAHEQRFLAHKQREEILNRLAKRPQQLRELHALRREAEAMGDPSRLAAAYLLSAQFYVDVGKPGAAAKAVAPALEYARQAGDRLAEAEAMRLRAAIARLAGQNDESLRLCELALAMVGQSPGNQAALLTRATLLNALGNTYWDMGKLEQGIESYAESLIIYRALRMPRLEARALSNMGIVFAALGEYEEALAHYKSALKIEQGLGDRSGIAGKLGHIGQCYADLGDFDRAEVYLSKAVKLARETGDPTGEADASVSLGQVKLARRHLTDAASLFERGLALAVENKDRFHEVRALQYATLADLALGGKAEAALARARTSIDLARRSSMAIGIAYGLAIHALALSQLGRHPEAIASIDEAVTLQDARARSEGNEQILAWQTRILEASGNQEAAERARRRTELEIEAKAGRLNDPELRRIFVESRKGALGVP